MSPPRAWSVHGVDELVKDSFNRRASVAPAGSSWRSPPRPGRLRGGATIPDLWQAFFFREPDWDVRDLILDALEELGQEVEEIRELNYLTEEVEIDLAEIGESLGYIPPDR